MVEIVDRVLQFLKDVFLALELARDVGERPHREALLALAVAERAHAHAQPARRLARLVAADPHLLLQAAAFARRLQQPVDRLRDIRVADEHPLDRAHVVGIGGVDQLEIGGIGVDHAAARVGDQDAVEGAVDHGLDQRVGGVAAGHAQDAGGEREQEKDADGGQHREQRQDIGAGVAAADQQQAGRRADQHQRDQEHEADAAAVAARPGAVDRRADWVSVDCCTAMAGMRPRCEFAAAAISPMPQVPHAVNSRKGLRFAYPVPPTARLSRMT